MSPSQAIQDTPENREEMKKILSSDRFRLTRKVRALLRHCATETMKGRGADLTQQNIAKALWRGKSFNPAMKSDVRSIAARLRQALDDYYRTDGSQDQIRFFMPLGHYYLASERRRVFPQRAAQVRSAHVKIPLTAFRDFLLAMAEPEGITAEQRNERVRDWMHSTYRFSHRDVSEQDAFNDLFQQLISENDELSLTEMRELTASLGIHPLLLDPLLLSEPIPVNWLVLDPDKFMSPDRPDESHGSNARYSVPTERLDGTDAKFVYLDLGPGGRSDIHHHPGDELALVLDGLVEYRFHDSGTHIRLRQGQLIHFHAEQTHSAVNLSSDSPARVFIIRSYQISACAKSAFPLARPRMRLQLRDALPTDRYIRDQSTAGWVLQALAGRSFREPPTKDISTIRDQLGLARMLRLMPPLETTTATQFHNELTRLLPAKYASLQEFICHLEVEELNLPRAVLNLLCQVYKKDVFDMLFLRFLFPAVPGAIVFRPDDVEDGVNPADLVSVPRGVNYVMPPRSLTCSDIAMAQLTLRPHKGTFWNQHPGHELLVPLRGRAELQLDRDHPQILAADGCAVDFLSEMRHRVWNPSADEDAVLFVVRLYGDRAAGGAF